MEVDVQAPERIYQSGVVKPMPTLKAEVHTDGHGPPRLRLRGEIDIATVPVLADSLSVLVDGGGDVVVDLVDVDFVGLAGLEVLCSYARSLRQRGDRLLVSSPSPIVRRVIDIIGVAELLSVSAGDPSLR